MRVFARCPEMLKRRPWMTDFPEFQTIPLINYKYGMYANYHFMSLPHTHTHIQCDSHHSTTHWWALPLHTFPSVLLHFLSAMCFIISPLFCALTAPKKLLFSFSFFSHSSPLCRSSRSLNCLAGRLILLPCFHPVPDSIVCQCSRCVNDVPLFGRHSALFSQIPVSITGCIITPRST